MTKRRLSNVVHDGDPKPSCGSCHCQRFPEDRNESHASTETEMHHSQTQSTSGQQGLPTIIHAFHTMEIHGGGTASVNFPQNPGTKEQLSFKEVVDGDTGFVHVKEVPGNRPSIPYEQDGESSSDSGLATPSESSDEHTKSAYVKEVPGTRPSTPIYIQDGRRTSDSAASKEIGDDDTKSAYVKEVPGTRPSTPIHPQDDSSSSNSAATTPERYYAEYIDKARSVVDKIGYIPVGHGEVRHSPEIPHNVSGSFSASFEDAGRPDSPLLPYNPTPGFEGQIHRHEFDVQPAFKHAEAAREFPPLGNTGYELAMKHFKPPRDPLLADDKTKSPAFAIAVDDDSSTLVENDDFEPGELANGGKPPTRHLAPMLHSHLLQAQYARDAYQFYHGEPTDSAAPTTGGPARVEEFADKIKFDKKHCEVPGSHKFYPAEEQQKDFIEGMKGQELGWCRICKKDHIPPGAPVTLADRDTCGAYLPEWFRSPAGKARPWEVFRALLNHQVRLDEIVQGYGHYHPDRPKWDKQFHEPSPAWTALGRRGGGWWKCRSGRNAPRMERSCTVCHGKVLGGELIPQGNTEEQFLEIVKAEKKNIEDFIAAQSTKVGEKDRKFVEERWSREGVEFYEDNEAERAKEDNESERTYKDDEDEHIQKDSEDEGIEMKTNKLK